MGLHTLTRTARSLGALWFHCNLRVFVFVLCAATAAAAVSSARVRPVFLSGAPAPAGLLFASFGRAAINARGSVCFLAGWDDAGRRRTGLYLRRDGQVVPIARTGDPVPGSPGVAFSFPYNGPDEYNGFSLNDRDEVAFVVRQGLFLYSGGEIRPIARIGEEYPGSPEEHWLDVSGVSLNNSGEACFIAATRSDREGDRREGVFLWSGGGIEIIYFVGDEVAGLDGELVGFSGSDLNATGDIATLGRVGEEEKPVILLTSGGETRIVAEAGAAAPGGTWFDLGSVALNDRGVLVFQGRITTETGEHSGLFIARNGVVNQVAGPGQPVAGTGGDRLGEFLARPAIDSEGAVAFLADLTGDPIRQALVVAAGGELKAAAVTRDGPPGGTGGSISQFSGLNLGSVEEEGVVCGTSIEGGAVTDAIVKYSTSKAPDVLVSTATPLPPGSVITLAEPDGTGEEVQAQPVGEDGVLFAGTVGGYGRALFRVTDGALELVTALGQLSEDRKGLRSVSSFAVNTSGQIVFVGARDTSGTDQALFVKSSAKVGTGRMVASTGQPVPDEPDRIISGLEPPCVDPQGGVVVAVHATQPGEPDVPPDGYLLRLSGGRRERLAGEGQRVEGAGVLVARPPDSDFSSRPGTFREVQCNGRGQVLFLSGYLDAMSGVYSAAGLFLLDAGTIRPVALPGQVAPINGSPLYTGFASPHLSDTGAISFLASVAGGGRKPRNALIRIEAGISTTIAVVGDPMPDVQGALIRSLDSPALSRAGDLTFFALSDRVTNYWNGAVLLWRDGQFHAVLPADGAASEPQGDVANVDGRAPVLPLFLWEDGGMLVVARLRGQDSRFGLFSVTGD